MSRDNDVQFLGSCKGFLIDVGTATIGSDGTIAVPTSLSSVKAAIAGHQDATVMSALKCSDVSSGNVTITDGAGADNEDATVWYIFFGLP